VRPYKYLLRTEALEFFHQRTSREREVLIRHFKSLAEYPAQEADYEYDEGGATTAVKHFGSWQITYWLDDPVRHVHILDIASV